MLYVYWKTKIERGRGPQNPNESNLIWGSPCLFRDFIHHIELNKQAQQAYMFWHHNFSSEGSSGVNLQNSWQS